MTKKTDKKTIVSRVWSFFTSLKLTVVILLTLAATSVIGTLIKQNETPAYYVGKFGTFFANLLYLFNIVDMYQSWWFRTLLTGLCINIIACSIHRLSAGWKIIFPKNLTLRPDRIKSGSNPLLFELPTSVHAASDIITPIISREYRFLQTKKTETGMTLSAEKHRWTRLGVYIVHFSVILMVLGGLIGSIFGFEGFATLPEGKATDRIFLKKNNLPHALPFIIRCDDFDVSFYRNGIPKEYKSQLTIFENNSAVLTKNVIVNDPLRYKGISIYQSSYGELPSRNPAVKDLTNTPVQIQFTSSQSGMMYTQVLVIGESFDLPEGQGSFLLKEHRKADTFGGQDIGDSLIAVITNPEGESREIQLPVRFAGFDRMRRGYFVFAIANAHELMAHDKNEAKQYYTGLHITKDPGVWVVYAGFILMIAGCYISFFMSHQQVLVEIAPNERHSRILLAGTTNKNKTGMALKLKALSKTIIKKSSEE